MNQSNNIVTLVETAKEIYDASSKSGLHYHNWNHVLHTLWAHTALFERSAADLCEQMALVWHDVVYVPGAAEGVNEELSALVFERFAKLHPLSLGAESDLVLEFGRLSVVSTLIKATKVKNHLSDQYAADLRLQIAQGGAFGEFAKSAQRVMDCDLAGLGSPYRIFLARQESIIREYTLREPTADDRAYSAKFLSGFLLKESIYHTEEARSKLETQARENIERFVTENI